MDAVLRDALPEFLGSLGAASVLALVAWGASYLRSRRAAALQARTEDQQATGGLESGSDSI
ncbi:hypothetical protein ACWF2L_40510 [Streptomyces anulatus]